MNNEELVVEYQQTKDSSTLNKIVEENEKLIHHILKRYRVDQFDYDDLFQEGSIGMLKAINEFDISKGFKFSTLAGIHIRSQATRYLEQTTIRHREVDSIDKPVGESGDADVRGFISDKNVNVEKLIIDKMYSKELDKAISTSCSIEEQQIIHLYYYLGLAFKDIQAVLGLENINRVGTIRDRSLRKLRRSKLLAGELDKRMEKSIDDKTQWISNVNYNSVGTGNSSRNKYSPVEDLFFKREKQRERIRKLRKSVGM